MTTAAETKESVKETLISILIAFVLAFVARSFVAEAFIIPTGSMAPTLLGSHMKFNNPQSGETWPVGPWNYLPRAIATDNADPMPVQRGDNGGPLVVHDPITGEEVARREAACRAGDRIMVLKYLYAVREPERFDVVVFKDPDKPAVNFIKRLTGLPGEQVALVDGDVFTRPAPADGAAANDGTWDEPGWQIRRKPARVQRAVWQPVYDSARVPADPNSTATPVVSPWQPTGTGWQVEQSGRSFVYRGKGDAPGVVEWNSRAEFARRSSVSREVEGALTREIVDRYAYNEGTQGWLPNQPGFRQHYPVSDVRLIAGVEPLDDGSKLRITGLLAARHHQFRAVVENGTASIQRRPSPSTAAPDPQWETVGSGAAPSFAQGRVETIDLWHYDQSLRLIINGNEVCSAEYDWTPAERIRNSTQERLSIADVLARVKGRNLPFAEPGLYTHASIQWQVSGGAVRLNRLAVERDIYYQPGVPYISMDRACEPKNTPTLNGNQFFVCGDNSPASHDCRAWYKTDPWVAAEMDATVGVVPRRMMLGKAFFVYFPALIGENPIPVPDFGRMRFIQ